MKIKQGILPFQEQGGIGYLKEPPHGKQLKLLGKVHF